MMEWVNSEVRIVMNDHGFTLGDLLAAPRGAAAARRPRLHRFQIDHGHSCHIRQFYQIWQLAATDGPLVLTVELRQSWQPL